MKYEISVEFIPDIAIGDESPEYQPYQKFMDEVGNAPNTWIDDITNYLKEWGSDCDISGGEIWNPDGLDWYVRCEFSPRILDYVQNEIEDYLRTVSNYIEGCPVSFEFVVEIFEKS